jgi:hypothetical protein
MRETCNLLLETIKGYQADASRADDINMVTIHCVK